MLRKKYEWSVLHRFAPLYSKLRRPNLVNVYLYTLAFEPEFLLEQTTKKLFLELSLEDNSNFDIKLLLLLPHMRNKLGPKIKLPCIEFKGKMQYLYNGLFENLTKFITKLFFYVLLRSYLYLFK